MFQSKKTLKCLTLVILSISMISCATIFKGQHANIRVNSQPSGANISINGIDKGTTPTILSLQRGEDHFLTFKKDGYEPLKINVQKNFDALTTILGNIVSFGVLGVVVDFVSGAAYSLKPADIKQNLQKMKKTGIINHIPKQKKNEINVIMLTKKQWQKVKAFK